MGVKIAFGSRAGGGSQMNGGGSQMNGGQMNGGGSQMNGGQMNYQNGGSSMNGGGQMQAAQNYGPGMNGGQMAMPHMGGYAMSYPVQTVPPAYMPGQPVPMHPQAAQMGFLAPLEQMGDYLGEEMRRGRSRSTGRFVHRAEMERGEEMRGASSRGREHDMGFADADEDEGEVQELKHQLKKLKKKVKKLERELEEKDEESGSSGSKKKKKKHEDEGEEEDEDDPVYQVSCALSSLLPGLPGFAEGVFGVMASPPPTWTDYMKKGDFAGIAKMEFGELLKAVQEKKPLKDLKKELFHTLGALLIACGR